jgi:hypothetical protein
MQSRRAVWSHLALLLCFVFVSCWSAFGQDGSSASRGRKYKAPPPTSHIEVVVSKKFNGKPIMNAAVVFDSTLNGKEEGNLEVKTDPDGKAVIDVIPTGSKVRVQIIANGFATYAEEYLVTEPNRQIFVSMLRPQEQISSYENNEGKATARKPGVQEPIRPTQPAKPATPPPASTRAPAPSPQSSSSPSSAPPQ